MELYLIQNLSMARKRKTVTGYREVFPQTIELSKVLNNSVYSIAANGTDIYVGGAFTLLGDGTTSANHIARWNIASFSWST